MKKHETDVPPSYSEAMKAGVSPRPPESPPGYVNPAVSPHSHQHNTSTHSSTTSHSSYRIRPPVPPPQQRPSHRPEIPWRYPAGFWCIKCHNTGFKVKNGKSCKDCWERFARQHNVNYTTTYAPSDPWRIPFTGISMAPQFNNPPMMAPPGTAPRYVRPGDPSMGGVLCGRCRGSGRVSVMWIDEDLCPVCHGVGRVF